jgi:hypothetical protein
MPWTPNDPLVDDTPGGDERPKKSKSAMALDGAAGPLAQVVVTDRRHTCKHPDR